MLVFAASLACRINIVPTFPRPRSLLLSSRCCHCCCCCRCCCRHCHLCGRYHCRRCHRQFILRRVHCCHRLPKQLPLDPRSLLLPPHRRTSPPLSNAVFIVNRVCHCRPPSPQSNAHGCFHHPSSPLLSTIFANVSFPLPLNAVKHCCPIKYPCLLLLLSFAIVERRR